MSLERHFLQDVPKDLSNVQNEETFERHVEMSYWNVKIRWVQTFA